MVAHEHLGVDGNGLFTGGIAQQIEVVMAVIVVYEDGPSIDAARRDVQRDTWKFKTWSTRHVAHVGKEQREALSADCTRSCKA